MKKAKSAEEILSRIIARDGRYALEAYQFVFESLEYTYRMIGERRHVGGKELLEGARRWAIAQYGPMSRSVLDHWGIRRCEDIGEVVFNLVEGKLLSATDRDRREDFKGGYDFGEAFDMQ